MDDLETRKASITSAIEQVKIFESKEDEMPPSEKDVEIGAVVQLRSGGPYMTVTDITKAENTTLRCKWFRDQEIKEADFKRDSCILWWVNADGVDVLRKLVGI